MKFKKILVVDDQPDIRKLIRYTLEDDGYEIHEVSDASIVMNMVLGLKPDLVLMDVVMPGELDGFDICEMIKSSNTGKIIPIIHLSAYGHYINVMKSVMSGADDFIPKPFSPIELIHKVQSALRIDGHVDKHIS